MADLKLARLPDRTPVKMTISIPPDLGQALAEYAEVYRQAYEQAESVSELIPAMLSSFIESDRVFGRLRREGRG